MTVFDCIREQADIIDAAQRYGLNIDRRGHALCPFHDDRHPSMTFRNNRFRCWACDTHGSVIDLTMRLCNLSELDAARQLNEDFRLGLDLDKPPDKEVLSKVRQDSALYESFMDWERTAFSVLATYYRALRSAREKLRPASPDASPHPLFIESLQMLDKVSYWLDILREGEFIQKVEFYKNNRKLVDEIGRKIGECGSVEHIAVRRRTG